MLGKWTVVVRYAEPKHESPTYRPLRAGR